MSCRHLPCGEAAHAQAKTRNWRRGLLASLQPIQHALPILLRAVEAVAIDSSFDTRDFARRGELPKRVRAFAVKPLRRGRDRAQPEMVLGKLALQHFAVKHRIRVDDRPLACMSLHRIEQDLDLGERRVARDLAGTGL